MNSMLTPLLLHRGAPIGLGLALVAFIGCAGGNHGASAAPPNIILSPQSQSVHAGANVSFNIVATGNPSPTCTWERSNDHGVTWTPIGGATTCAYGFTAQLVDDDSEFRVLASNPSGSLFSSTAKLSVKHAVYASSIGIGNPGYWLNECWITEPLPPGYALGGAIEGLAITPDGLYAAGKIISASEPIMPGYWLNGTWVGLALEAGSTDGWACSIVNSGSDVYVGGFCINSQGYYDPGYWLNGRWNSLPMPPGSLTGAVNQLVLSGGSLYAAGFTEGLGGYSPGYWLNGNWVELLLPPGGGPLEIASATVIGSDIYAWASSHVDATGNFPGYWLNETWVPLDSTPGAIKAVTVVGRDVYAAGYRVNEGLRRVPGYWRNGAWQSLPPADGCPSGEVGAITVVDGHVYAGGGSYFTVGGSSTPGYWLDGVLVSLPVPPNTGNYFINSLCVP